MAGFSSLPTRWRWLAAGFYAGLCGWYSWPLAQQPASAFAGRVHRDPSIFLWNVWNFRAQLAAGHNPFHTDALFYPRGASLWLHTYTPVLGGLNAALNQPFLALNLGIWLSFVLSGVGAAWLAGRWVRQPLLCVVVGFVFAFSPYKLARWPEHANLLLTATVPFFLAAYLQAFEFQSGRLPRLRNGRAAALAAGLWVLTLFSDYYVLAGLCYLAAGYAAWWWLRLGNLNWRRWPAWAGLVAVVVVGHYLSRGLGLLGFDDHAGLYWGADLAGFVVPPLGNRWLSTPGSVAFWHSPRLLTPASVENVVFVGYLLPLLALGLALTWAARRRAGLVPAAPLPTEDADTAGPAEATTPAAGRLAEVRPLWALTLLFVLLTAPELRWQGHDFWRMPTSLVHYVPFFNNIRCPTRHVLFVTLLLALAVSLGLDGWLRRGPAGRGWLVSGALLLGLLVEFQVTPLPLVRAADVPAAYRVAAAAAPGAVLFPVPFGVQDGYHVLGRPDAADMFYQTQTGGAQPGGYLARVSAETFAAYRRDPALRALLTAQTAPDSLALLPAPPPDAVAAFQRTYGQAVFVVAPSQRGGPAHQLLRQWLLPTGYREQLVPAGDSVYALLRR